VIFFARYEASQFGSTTIETEHFLLGLIREDKNLVNRFLRQSSSIESIRKEIEGRVGVREKVSTSIDLPMSDECKRILALANEEAEHLHHRHLGTEHLLLGILREEKCLAAEILRERGLLLDEVREQLARSGPDDSLPDVGMALHRFGSMTAPGFSLLQSLKVHSFDVPMEHAMKAWGAQRQHDWVASQTHLQNFMNSLSEAVKEKAADPKLLEGFVWQPLMEDLRTGLTSDEDSNVRFRLAMLLGEVMIKRLEQRLNS
jgi:ATP-dependent Clp protease ATP-binding subunit ClpA